MREQLLAMAAATGFVGSHRDVMERAQANGVYHGVWEGYKTEHEREYTREMPRLLEHRAKV